MTDVTPADPELHAQPADGNYSYTAHMTRLGQAYGIASHNDPTARADFVAPSSAPGGALYPGGGVSLIDSNPVRPAAAASFKGEPGGRSANGYVPDLGTIFYDPTNAVYQGAPAQGGDEHNSTAGVLPTRTNAVATNTHKNPGGKSIPGVTPTTIDTPVRPAGHTLPTVPYLTANVVQEPAGV